MNEQIKVLVTGSNGQVGSELNVLSTHYPGLVFKFTDRSDMPITDAEAIENCFRDFHPDYCINCAAYTAVDKAEDAGEDVIAERINADAVGVLAKACTATNTKLIHISTDYVFDGTAHQPYQPDDATHPVSVYGATKLKGEQLAAANADAVIIRTAWVYS
ncbi:MAG: sugar nucleotide-binding protein, partial [Niabella sp.]|nr:sugar nucleotide-binding protein [Niabella sp.]